MKTDLLLSRLDKVRKTQKGWNARCPAHEDKTASLSIAESDGKVLIHCFAGCRPADIVGAVGMELGDLFADKRSERVPMSKRDRKDMFALMAATSPSLAFDIEVMRIGLQQITTTGLMPADADTFIGSAKRTLDAISTLAKRPYTP